MTAGRAAAVRGLRAGGLGAEGGVARGGGDPVAGGWEDPQSGLGGTCGDEECPDFSCVVLPSGLSWGRARGPRDGAWEPLFRHREANGRWRLCSYRGRPRGGFPPPPTEKPRRDAGELTLKPVGVPGAGG